MIRPFSCGSQYADWEDYNCCQCAKYPPEDQWQSLAGRAAMCPIALAMGEAYFTGEIADEIARRAAYPGPGRYNWRCGEFSPQTEPEEVPHNRLGSLKAFIVSEYLAKIGKTGG